MIRFGGSRAAPESRANQGLTGGADNRWLLYSDGMEVNLSPDLETRLSRMACREDRTAEMLIREAVEKLVTYEDWFLGEVDRGLAAAEQGEFIEHDDVRALIDRWYPA
jgi:predicted transcriptional regulator